MKLFGLDISDSIIRLAVVEKSGRSFKLPVRGEIPVPDGAINDGALIQPETVADLLKQLLAAAKPATKKTVVTLPERHSFIKVVSLPTGTTPNDDNVKNAVLPHLPYDWDELTWDWHILTSTKEKAARIMFGCAPTELVNSYIKILSAAGIEAVGMEIESVAIARAMLRPEQTGSYIILDVGRTRTSLILLNNGVVELSTTIRYAGKDLNQYIAEALRISPDQAQRAKELFGLDPGKGKGLLARVLAPQLDIIAKKVQTIEEYYGEHFDGEPPIGKILLNGSGALIKNIDLELSKRLKIPVVCQPAWLIDELSTNPADVHDIAYTYTTAIGLALQQYYPTP